MSNVDTLRQILSNDLAAKWVNLRDYALDKLEANSAIKAIMNDIDKYGYGEWACNTMTVPKLASNSQEGYNATASESNSRISSAPWKAFDRDDSTNWSTNDGSSSFSLGSKWLKIELPTAKSIGYIHLKARAGKTNNTCLFSYQLLGSTDDVTYENLTGVIGDRTFSTDIKEWNVKTISIKPYKYIKVNVGLANSGGLETYATIQTLDLYTWGPLGNVPIMTANNAPYGEAIATSEVNTSYKAFMAFNGHGGESSNVWAPATSDTAPAIGYKFINPVCVKRIKYQNYVTNTNIASFRLEASDDGTTYTPIGSVITNSNLEAYGISYYEIDNDEYHLYWRIKQVAKASGVSLWNCAALQFYGREQGTLYPTELLSSQSQNGYVVTESSYYTASNNNHPGYGAFRNSPFSIPSTSNYYFWNAANRQSSTEWVQIQLPRAICFNAVYIKAYYNFPEIPKIKWKILGSNDGFISDIHELITNMNFTPGTGQQIAANIPLDYFSFENNIKYKYYRLVGETKDGTTVTASHYFVIAAIKFVENTYSEKEFAQGSTRKTIYDHGLELETIETKTIGTGAVATKEPNQLYISVPSSAGVQAVIGGQADFSSYSSLIAKVGNKFKGDSAFGYFVNLPVSSVTPPTGYVVVSNTNSVVSNIYPTLDISSVNGTNHAVLNAGHNANGTFKESTITELWLE